MKQPPLIPRKILFADPDRSAVTLSPDGSHVAYLAPLDGVRNVWVATRDDVASARAVTHDKHRGIRTYFWAHTNRHVLYLQDSNGDENWRLHAVDLETGEDRDLTPLEGVQAHVMAVSYKFPEEVIVGLNDRDPQWHDVYRLNIITGERSLMLRHDRFAQVVVDHDHRVRFALAMTADGGMEVFAPDGDDRWRACDTIGAEDVLTTGYYGFDKGGKTAFMYDSRGRDTAALVALDVETDGKTLLAEDPKADAGEVMIHPTERHIQAVAFTYERKRWQVLDQTIDADLAYLKTLADGDVEVVSRTLDDSCWITLHVLDNGPGRFHLYDRVNRKATFLFTNRTQLEGKPLARMWPVVIKSRDGLDLVVYYSLPVGSDSDDDGIPDQPLPMVFMPHGGPWWRDSWGYNTHHQWLANRGYAVLCVNFRASTGFGKSFTNAGDLQWGRKVHEDQIDAVQWAVAAGLADPERIAVLGGSFGGYSALAGLTFTPEVFACAVDLVGPSSLITLLESMPPYWKPMLELFTKRVGDHRSEQGRALLTEHSPLTYVDRINRPLLIGQGANDPRVKQAESDQIVQAMQAKGIPVTYVLYPDEGHGFARPENNKSFFAIAEAFLSTCLGGRVEPIGDDFTNSSLQVPAGKEQVPGLPEALGETA